MDSEDGTPLHQAASRGHPEVVKLLGQAGAALEAQDSQGRTPLHCASSQGHLEIVAVLIDAGANANSRTFDGTTSLYSAALLGRAGAARLLLGAKASPLLTVIDQQHTYTPLGAAANRGHLDVVRELMQHPEIEDVNVVRELIRHSGIEDDGDENSHGIDALGMAAQTQQVDIMAMLANAGAVDTGIVLLQATAQGGELSMKFLLRQQPEDGLASYVNNLTRWVQRLRCAPVMASAPRGWSSCSSTPELARHLPCQWCIRTKGYISKVPSWSSHTVSSARRK